MCSQSKPFPLTGYSNEASNRGVEPMGRRAFRGGRRFAIAVEVEAAKPVKQLPMTTVRFRTPPAWVPP
jgi:hypothetical protein